MRRALTDEKKEEKRRKKKRKRKKKGQKTSFFTLKPNFVEGGHPQSLETKRFIQIRVEPPPTDF